MTCIVGYQDKGRVWLGGDSATTADGGETVEISDEPKVWINGGCVWGGAGENRYLDLVHHALVTPKLPRAYKSDARNVEALRRWLANDLVHAIHDCWRPALRLRSKDDPLPEFVVLLGVRGRLYEIGADGAFDHLSRGYGAVGSGALPALGVLDALASTAIRPKERLARALSVAAERTTIVRPPFKYVSA